LGGLSSEPPAQTAPSRRAGSREGVRFAALVRQHLSDDVGGRAKPVQANPPTLPRQPERTVTDKARAHERCDVGGVSQRLRQREDEIGGGHGVLGESSVTVEAGEPRLGAKVLLAAHAVLATPAGGSQPGYADAATGQWLLDALPDRLHDAHDLVAGDAG
jgi:hypothetical protein